MIKVGDRVIWTKNGKMGTVRVVDHEPTCHPPDAAFVEFDEVLGGGISVAHWKIRNEMRLSGPRGYWIDLACLDCAIDTSLERAVWEYIRGELYEQV